MMKPDYFHYFRYAILFSTCTLLLGTGLYFMDGFLLSLAIPVIMTTIYDYKCTIHNKRVMNNK